MNNKTYIKGKDRDLESSIETMLAKLSTCRFEIKEMSSLNPVSHAYSIHIEESTCRFLFTNGKGNCEKSSYASALGEFFERLCTNFFFADYYLGKDIASNDFVFYPNEKWFEYKDGLLNEELWKFYDKENSLEIEQIYELNSGAGERGVCALPFESFKDENIVYFPVNILNNLYVSNGMSAGNTASEARVQALCEILERHVKNKIISEAICLPEIPKEVLQRFKQTNEIIQKLQDYGYSLRVCDASLGGIFPVISVTLINPKDGSVFASFGSHPCFEVALERTVTELLQGRDLDNFNDFKAPTFDLDEVSDSYNLEDHFVNSSGLLSYEFFKNKPDYEFVFWNMETDTQDELKYITNLIYKNGYEIYIADYEYMGVYTCRIVIPKMSEIYSTTDLIWANNNQGAILREDILNLKNLDDMELEDLLENIENTQLDESRKVSELIGIIPDENTLWEELLLGELKAMIYLALDNFEMALQLCSWSLLMVQDEKRVLFYRCLTALLEIEIDEEKELETYFDSLVLMYSKEMVSTCRNLIEVKDKFYGLEIENLNLEGFKEHTKLINAYKNLHEQKRKYYG